MSPDFPLTVRHYANLAEQPGWIDYAWRDSRNAVDHMEREHPADMAGLRESVRAELERRKAARTAQ